MGKYSNKQVNRPRDFWATVDPSAIPSAFVDEVRGKTYAEPCYGAGDLEDLLMEVATCKWRSDIEPQVASAKALDALAVTDDDLKDCDLIVTNPPFSWAMLDPLLSHFISLKPTWVLLPADFMHNKRSYPYMENCSRVIAIRRLFWVLDSGDLSQSGVKGKDNYCWFNFHSEKRETIFVGRP